MAEFLEGYSSFYSHSRRIDINNTLSIFEEDGRAGFLVGSLADPTDRDEVTYGDPAWCARINVIIQMLHEKAGMPLAGKPVCDHCEGTGFWTDVDGDLMECPECSQS